MPGPGLGSLPPTTFTALPEPKHDSTAKQKPKRRGALFVLLAAALSVVGIAGAVLFLLPRTGTLNVYVSGPNGRDVGPVDVYVDNERVCTSSPCSVPALKPGIHDVSVEAKGYASPATKGVEITVGSGSKFEIELFEAPTGFAVAGSHPGIVLLVDGKEVGALPQSMTTLRPGEHELRFVGSERYAPLTRTVTVVPNKVEDLGEIKLEVARGLATFEVVTEGARMRLVPGEGEARELDGGALENGRLSVDIDTSKEWKLEACSLGYESFELPISFEDGQAEKTFRVELVKNEAMGRARLKSWCHGGRPAATARAGQSAGQPASHSAGHSAGESGGKLSFNSIPPSAAVLLDGKPVGRTPMAGVVVSPGSHTVVFVHPEKGRKATSVTVAAGQSRGVGVRF